VARGGLESEDARLNRLRKKAQTPPSRAKRRIPLALKCPREEGFLVAALLGMTPILTFSAASEGGQLQVLGRRSC
jgi:hypothetical protein